MRIPWREVEPLPKINSPEELVEARQRSLRRHAIETGIIERLADLIGKDLRRADLRGADLRGACLIGADLRDADLRDADVIGADLRGADLRGADLTGSIFLTQPQLDAATGDEGTRLPSPFTRPAHRAGHARAGRTAAGRVTAGRRGGARRR